MKKLTEEFLNSKRVQSYANKRDIDIQTGFEAGTDGDDLKSLEVCFFCSNPKEDQTEDDSTWYRIRTEGLFYGGVYQIDGAEEFPYWIKDWDSLKEFINYLSKITKREN